MKLINLRWLRTRDVRFLPVPAMILLISSSFLATISSITSQNVSSGSHVEHGLPASIGDFPDKAKSWITNKNGTSLTQICFISEFQNIGKRPQGINDKTEYDEIINHAGYVVDKSLLIEALVNSPENVNIIVYPKRFGKSTNLKMLKLFFAMVVNEKGKRIKNTVGSKLFRKGEIVSPEKKVLKLVPPLLISKNTNIIQHQGEYPVIYMNFGEIECGGYTYKEFIDGFGAMVCKIFRNHFLYVLPLLQSEMEDPDTSIKNIQIAQAEFTVLEKFVSQQINEILLGNWVPCLSAFFHRRFHRNTFVLIDGYDLFHNELLLLSEATGNPKAEDTVLIRTFVRTFFELSFKNNDFLEMAILTGSSTSDDISKSLDFARTVNFHDEDFNPFYGLQQGEVLELVKAYQPEFIPRFQELRFLYNGHNIQHNGVIYPLFNTFSITEFVRYGKLEGFWMKSESLLKDFMLFMYFFISNNFRETVIGSIGKYPKPIIMHFNTTASEFTMEESEKVLDYINECKIDGITCIPNSNPTDHIFFKLMFYNGYLTSPMNHENDHRELTLKIPNKDIRDFLHMTLMTFYSHQLGVSANYTISFAEYFHNFISIDTNVTEEEFTSTFENLLNTVKPIANLSTFSKKANRVLYGDNAVVHHILTASAIYVDCREAGFDLYLPTSGESPDFLFIRKKQVTILEVEFNQTSLEPGMNRCKGHTDHVLYEVLHQNRRVIKPNTFTFRYIVINVSQIKRFSVKVETNFSVPYREDGLKSFQISKLSAKSNPITTDTSSTKM